MPVHPVKGQPGCYQWGESGKVYCGDGAKEKAEAQGRAAYASGYKGKAEMQMPTKPKYQESDDRWWLYHKWEVRDDKTLMAYQDNGIFKIWVLLNPYQFNGRMESNGKLTFICTTKNADAKEECLNWISFNLPEVKGKSPFYARKNREQFSRDKQYYSVEFDGLTYREEGFGRKRLDGYAGFGADEAKKNFTTIEDIEIGDVFKFGDGWERFVLKSKEIDGYEWDSKDDEQVVVYYKIVFDPYKPSPVSNIEGLVKSNAKIVRWDNVRLQMARRRRGLEAEESEEMDLESFREGLYHLYLKGKIAEAECAAWSDDYEAFLQGEGVEKPPFAAETFDKEISFIEKKYTKEQLRDLLNANYHKRTFPDKIWGTKTYEYGIDDKLLEQTPLRKLSMAYSYEMGKRNHWLKGKKQYDKTEGLAEWRWVQKRKDGRIISNPKMRLGAESDKKTHSVEISRSSNPEKKLMAVFSDKEGNKIKTTHFGQRGASDYTKHGDKERMERYLERHGGGTTTSTKEDWKDPTTAGALSRWILWNKPSLSGSFSDFKRRFGLKGSMKVSKSAEQVFNVDMIKERFFDKQLAKYEDKLDWAYLSSNPSLTPALIEKYKDRLNWAYLSANPSLTPALIEKYEDRLDWEYLSENPSLTLALIEKYGAKLDWENLSWNPSLTPVLIEKYEDKWDWETLSWNPSLTPVLIEKYEDKWDWNYLSRNHSLTPALIEKYEDRLNWNLLSANPSLTPALIEKYIDNVNWDLLSANPSLTPALIEKYKDRLNWVPLSSNPSLTPALIEKYIDKWDLNWEKLSQNPSLTPALIEKYKEELNWVPLSRNPSLTPALIEKYKDRLNWVLLSSKSALFGKLYVKKAAEGSLSPAQKSLNKWTREDWGTKSGKPSTQGEEATGERYLPRKAREALTDKEYARTSAKKRRDTAKGKQFSQQPDDVEEKVKKYRAEQPVPKSDIVMDFYEEMLYDEDSDLFKMHQELNPPNQKPNFNRQQAYNLFIYSFWKDEVPKNNRNGTPKTTKELIRSANDLQRKNPKKLPITELTNFYWTLGEASQKYEIRGRLKERFNEVRTPWLSYKNKIYYWGDMDTISSLNNDFVKEEFLSLPPQQKMAILHKNWERFRDYRFSKEELEELTAGAIFKELRWKGFDFYVPQNEGLNKDKMIEIYEKRMEKYAEQVFEAIEGKGSKARFTDQPDPKTYRDTGLRQKARNDLLKGTKGGDAGEWSARKAQMAATRYRTLYENKYGEGKNPYF